MEGKNPTENTKEHTEMQSNQRGLDKSENRKITYGANIIEVRDHRSSTRKAAMGTTKVVMLLVYFKDRTNRIIGYSKIHRIWKI